MHRILSVLLAWSAVAVFAQPQQHLTLDQAISQAQGRSLSAQASRYDYQTSRYGYQEYLSSTKPQVTLSASPLYAHSNHEQSYNYVSPTGYNLLGTDLTASVSQQMQPWGGYFYADTKSIWSELLGDMRSQYGTDRLWGFTPLRLGYKQDLLGYNPHKWEKKIEEKNLEHADRLQAFRLMQIAEQVTDYYFSYVSSQSYYDTYRQNYLTTDTLYTIAQKKYLLTTVTKAELMSIELERLNAKTRQDNALTELNNARRSLLSYLQLPDEGQELELQLPEFPEDLTIDASTVTTRVAQCSPELLEYDTQMLETEQQLAQVRRQKGLAVGLDVSVGVQQYNAHIGDAFRHMKPYTMAQVSLSIPLYDAQLQKNREGKARSALETLKLQSREYRRQLEDEAATIYNSLMTQYRTLPEAHRGSLQAEEAFQLVRQQYANGLLDSNTYMLAQSRKDEVRDVYVSLLCNFWMNYYRLCRLTLYDYINDKPLLL